MWGGYTNFYDTLYAALTNHNIVEKNKPKIWPRFTQVYVTECKILQAWVYAAPMISCGK